MKAKEYAKMFLDAVIHDKPYHLIMSQFVEEMQSLIKTRNIKSTRALISLLNEYDDKWRAICRIVNSQFPLLKEEGFQNIIKRNSKPLADLMGVVKMTYKEYIKHQVPHSTTTGVIIPCNCSQCREYRLEELVLTAFSFRIPGTRISHNDLNKIYEIETRHSHGSNKGTSNCSNGDGKRILF